MILVFDLDDTLYNELDYVKSGFRAVSDYLDKEYGLNADSSYNSMLKSLEKGRGKIFDEVLDHHNIKTKKAVRKCLSVYRMHKPIISLFPEAIECLEGFKNYKKYIVTDGNKIVEKNKYDALKLDRWIEKIYITYRHGIKNSKPSPYCFLQIAKKQKSKPEDIVYIGDNPVKDFIGIKSLGFKTVRVLTGQHRNVYLTDDHEADATIKSLTELSSELIESLKNGK